MMELPPTVYTAATVMTFIMLVAPLHPSPSQAASDTYDGPPTPCDKELSVSDVSDLLISTAHVQHYSELASTKGEGCTMGIGGGSSFAMVDVAAKPGDAAMLKILGGHGPHSKPIPGIGDEAWTDGEVVSNMGLSKHWGIMKRAIRPVGYIAGWGLVDGMDAAFGWDRK